MEKEVKKEQEKEQSQTNDEQLQQKADEYLNNWKRAAADLANYKKEEVVRAGMLVNYAKEDMLFKILLVIDSFYLAQAHIPEEIEKNDWVQGFLQIKNQIQQFLKNEGVEEIKTLGQQFDLVTMEALGEVDGEKQGQVAEELQKGYMMGGKVLRPAKVKVVK